MKIEIKIKAKYVEHYVLGEPSIYPFKNIVEMVNRQGVHFTFEKLVLGYSKIFIHKHKLFNYIFAFQKPYRISRFK